LIGLAILGLVAGTTAAQYSQTIPPNHENVAGGGLSGVPFNLTQTTKVRAQYFYDSSFFCVQAPILITGISFRPRWSGLNNPTGGDWIDVSIDLGTITDLTTATTTFNSNHTGSPAVNVRSGPYMTGPVVPSDGPTANWISFGPITPYAYDPSTRPGSHRGNPEVRCHHRDFAPGW
jgi:hypothetical protein